MPEEAFKIAITTVAQPKIAWSLGSASNSEKYGTPTKCPGLCSNCASLEHADRHKQFINTPPVCFHALRPGGMYNSYFHYCIRKHWLLGSFMKTVCSSPNNFWTNIRSCMKRSSTIMPPEASPRRYSLIFYVVWYLIKHRIPSAQFFLILTY
jgi:hypothetical protein